MRVRGMVIVKECEQARARQATAMKAAARRN